MNQFAMQKKIEAMVNNTEFVNELTQCETCNEITALFGT
jgi:hypothetical protein